MKGLALVLGIAAVFAPAAVAQHPRSTHDVLRVIVGTGAPTEIVVRERTGVRHIYTIKRCQIGQISPLTGAAPLGPPPC